MNTKLFLSVLFPELTLAKCRLPSASSRQLPLFCRHMVDSTISNTYRALRFVSKARGNKLYAEFTKVTDWNFTAPDIFIEIFNVDQDPGTNTSINGLLRATLESYDAERAQRQNKATHP